MSEITWLYMGGHGIYVWGVVVFCVVLVAYELITLYQAQRQCQRQQQQLDALAQSESSLESKGEV